MVGGVEQKGRLYCPVLKVHYFEMMLKFEIFFVDTVNRFVMVKVTHISPFVLFKQKIIRTLRVSLFL